MLEVQNLAVSYGSIKALHGITLQVPEKAIVTLIGANGAGKSTTLRAISGLVKSSHGSVKYDGQEITGMPAHKIVARGLCHVPEGRMVFANLTVEENLRMGAYLRRDAAGIREDLDYCFHVFPRLKERLSQLAGTLSGGRAAAGRTHRSTPLASSQPDLNQLLRGSGTGAIAGLWPNGQW